ncbi:MAG: TIGR03067 domain-containing protein [Isosphaeraceae bacterium]|nr:TIGR03067 domain-containing protein [Isosphaeraceae bacterium]
MVALLVCLSLLPAQTRVERPTAAQVEQAHQLLNGDWEILSLVEDGESLGRELIREKLAAGGRVTISDRTFRVTNPETHETRVSPFRLDITRNPRRIDVTTREDRTVGGIYRFEGDELLVCLETFPDSGYPADFDASPGSSRTLVRLRMIPRGSAPAVIEKPAAPAAIEKPAATPLPTRSAAAPDAEAKPAATTVSSRRPTETELARVRELFSGNWDIVSIVDDGENLGAELIRRRFAENGQIRFGTRAFAIISPKTEERRVSAYRIDPTTTPSHIDITTQFDTILKGIYRFDGDRLDLCLAKVEEGARPDTFDAPGGSGRILMRLRLSPETEPKPIPVSETKPVAQTKPAPAATPAPVTSPEEEERKREASIRRMLTGSWTMTDTKGTLTSVFQPDGTFVATRVWSRSGKRLFGPPSDSSNGSWTYGSGILSAWVTTTTDPRIAGHQIRGRVQSVGNDSFVVTDAFGTVKTFRRLR